MKRSLHCRTILSLFYPCIIIVIIIEEVGKYRMNHNVNFCLFRSNTFFPRYFVFGEFFFAVCAKCLFKIPLGSFSG